MLIFSYHRARSNLRLASCKVAVSWICACVPQTFRACGCETIDTAVLVLMQENSAIVTKYQSQIQDLHGELLILSSHGAENSGLQQGGVEQFSPVHPYSLSPGGQTRLGGIAEANVQRQSPDVMLAGT